MIVVCKGIAIAIIDTGVNDSHHNMVMKDSENVKFTEDEMREKIDALGYGEYISEKVPFAYSYISGRTEVMNDVQIHGHHVAGIAAAWGKEDETYTDSDGTVRHNIAGVAPDAQIFAMQIFDSFTGTGGCSDDLVCAIEDAVKLGADIVNLSLGTSAGFLEQDRECSRCHETQAQELPAIECPSEGYTDVAANTWYTDAVIWATDLGIVNGMSLTTFEPDTNISREQIAVILYRAAGEPKPEKDMTADYPDAGTVSVWAKDAMSWAITVKLIGGSDGKLLPLDNASRAEAAAILLRMVALAEKK